MVPMGMMTCSGLVLLSGIEFLRGLIRLRRSPGPSGVEGPGAPILDAVPRKSRQVPGEATSNVLRVNLGVEGVGARICPGCHRTPDEKPVPHLGSMLVTPRRGDNPGAPQALFGESFLSPSGESGIRKVDGRLPPTEMSC